LCELIEASSNSPEILEPTETALNNVAVLIGFLVVTDFLFAIGSAWYHRLDAELFEECPDGVAIIAFVGEKLFNAGDQTDAFLRHRAISGVTGCNDEGPRAAEFVDYRVDLAVATAFREPDRLKIGPPFPPPAQRCTFT
jgi:hypothetical protein